MPAREPGLDERTGDEAAFACFDPPDLEASASRRHVGRRNPFPRHVKLAPLHSVPGSAPIVEHLCRTPLTGADRGTEKV